MRRLSATAVAVTLIISMWGGAITPARAVGGGPVSYLALGDSLAVGYQPNRGQTTGGYVDDLWRRIRQGMPALSLRNVGCAGETSRSLITGEHSPCHYAAGSQLDAALSFLLAHPGEVAFITIDVGANDLLNHCLGSDLLIRKPCTVGLVPKLQTRLTEIVDALATAAPGVPIVAMRYYNPFLGLWGLIRGGRALAHADQHAWTVFNGALASAYAGAGATVADVAATFRIDDFTPAVVVPGRGRVPVNVALSCRWTWFCSPRFAGDPHANRVGYRKIARTFFRELQGLLP